MSRDPSFYSSKSLIGVGFTSLLRQLEALHDNECEQRKDFEAKLQTAKTECAQMRAQLQARDDLHISPRSHNESIGSKGDPADSNQISCSFAVDDRHVQEKPHLTDACLQTSFQQPSPSPRVSLFTPQSSKKRSLKKNDQSSSWPETDVREFALMRGWQKIDEKIQDRKSRANGEVTNSLPVNVNTQITSHSYADRRSPCQKKMAAMVEHQMFDVLSAIAIVANTVLIGVAADYVARNKILLINIPLGFKVAERIFTVVFSIELILRLVAGGTLFFTGPNKSWNIFDLIVVSGDVLQTLLETFIDNKSIDLKILRVLRVTRITRAIRVIRLVMFFKELRMMVFSILRCGTSLMWSLMLFFIVIFMFGMFLITQVTDFLVEDGGKHPRSAEMWDFFGTVPRTIYTLYACMAGGISWIEVTDDLIDVHWSNALVLCFFVFFTLFVVSNILTGIFVDTAIQSATNDRDEIVQEQLANQESELMQLKAAFEEADKDDSGTITSQEFCEHMKDQTVRAHLAHIGIEVHQAMGMFKLLDLDRNGHVNIEEFVMGCMRLKGGAKSIDLATLMYENKRLVERITQLETLCKQQFENLWFSQETADNKVLLKRITQLDVFCRDRFQQLNIFQAEVAQEMHLPGKWHSRQHLTVPPARISPWDDVPVIATTEEESSASRCLENRENHTGDDEAQSTSLRRLAYKC